METLKPSSVMALPTVDIRDAQVTDAKAMLEIYTPIVEQTAISFELEPPSPEDFRQKIASIRETHAWLIAETDQGIAGYVYGSSFRPRAAYRYSVETTAYIHPDFRGQGIAKQLYLALFERLKTLGFYNAYAVIALPNLASEALHKRMGFKAIGVFPRVGFKFGQWHDTAWYYKLIQEGQPSEL